MDTGKIKALKFPTFWFEATPQGKFMLSVAFGQAKYYTDNLRENILRGIRQKLRRGELPAKAPIGYFNEPKLRTIEPDRKTFRESEASFGSFCDGKLHAVQNPKQNVFSWLGCEKWKAFAFVHHSGYFAKIHSTMEIFSTKANFTKDRTNQ